MVEEKMFEKRNVEICENCGGHGYIQFRNGGDENCVDCGGEGYTIGEGDE